MKLYKILWQVVPEPGTKQYAEALDQETKLPTHVHCESFQSANDYGFKYQTDLVHFDGFDSRETINCRIVGESFG